VWGNGALERFGEGSAYAAAAVLLIGASALIGKYQAPTRGHSGS